MGLIFATTGVVDVSNMQLLPSSYNTLKCLDVELQPLCRRAAVSLPLCNFKAFERRNLRRLLLVNTNHVRYIPLCKSQNSERDLWEPLEHN